jgi:hypothetical protein
MRRLGFDGRTAWQKLMDDRVRGGLGQNSSSRLVPSHSYGIPSPAGLKRGRVILSLTNAAGSDTDYDSPGCTPRMVPASQRLTGCETIAVFALAGFLRTARCAIKAPRGCNTQAAIAVDTRRTRAFLGNSDLDLLYSLQAIIRPLESAAIVLVGGILVTGTPSDSGICLGDLPPLRSCRLVARPQKWRV